MSNASYPVLPLEPKKFSMTVVTKDAALHKHKILKGNDFNNLNHSAFIKFIKHFNSFMLVSIIDILKYHRVFHQASVGTRKILFVLKSRVNCVFSLNEIAIFFSIKCPKFFYLCGCGWPFTDRFCECIGLGCHKPLSNHTDGISAFIYQVTIQSTI